ncbi:MAG: glycosyltransferase family 2 protein [Rudaea sp.]
MPTVQAGTLATPALSVVMPCYNEADNIDGAIRDVVLHVFSEVPDAELVVVDDGSRDASAAIVRGWTAREPRVRLVVQVNVGHGPALARGIRAAHGTHCLLLDSDRQIGLGEFGATWALREGCDAVLGVRRDRADAGHRLLLTAALRAWLAMVLRVRSADPNVPYKLVPRTTLLDALDAMPAHPLIPSILLTVYLNRRGLRIAEQAVPHAARAAGETSLRPRRLAAFCSRALGELMRFHRALRRAR